MSYLSMYGWSNLGHSLCTINSSIFLCAKDLIEQAHTKSFIFCAFNRISVHTVCILCVINVIGVHVVCIVCAACVHTARTLPFADQQPSIVQMQHPQGHHGGGGGDPACSRPG
jgi:hypothetical protein